MVVYKASNSNVSVELRIGILLYIIIDTYWNSNV